MITIATPGLTFDESTHVYRIDDVEVPSVTAVIRDNGLGGDFSRVDSGVLNRTRTLGRAVHAALHYMDEATLDEATIDDRVAPYLYAWQCFKDDHRVSIVEMERRIADAHLCFAGTLDRLVLADPHRLPALVDIKTGGVDGAAYQTAAYAYLAACSPATARWAVQLHPDRVVPYSIHPFRDVRDWRIFRSALELTHERARLGRHWMSS